MAGASTSRGRRPCLRRVRRDPALRERAEAALANFHRAGTPKEKEEAGSRLAGLAADADSAVRYGERLWSPTAAESVHQRVENSLKRGITASYQLGQLLAMPALLDRPQVKATSVAGPRLPLPGQPGFDPWCLTDPATRGTWQRDPAARRAIDTLWRHDPDPVGTLTIQSEIDAALAAGAIGPALTADGRRFGNYYCCPWSAVCTVHQPVTVAGRPLRPMQQFTFDVSAEEIAEGGEFKRGLLMGPFHPTSEVDYCGPDAGGHG